MEAILIIIAVHSNNPKDIPGRLELKLPSIEVCEKVKDTIVYELKFKQFVLESKCEKRS